MAEPEIYTCAVEWWWIFPIAMILLCIFMSRRRRGSIPSCFAPRGNEDVASMNTTDSASQILDKRYALGEIGKKDYEEKKLTLNQL